MDEDNYDDDGFDASHTNPKVEQMEVHQAEEEDYGEDEAPQHVEEDVASEVASKVSEVSDLKHRGRDLVMQRIRERRAAQLIQRLARGWLDRSRY
jgi:hypothetical protein